MNQFVRVVSVCGDYVDRDSNFYVELRLYYDQDWSSVALVWFLVTVDSPNRP